MSQWNSSSETKWRFLFLCCNCRECCKCFILQYIGDRHDVRWMTDLLGRLQLKTLTYDVETK